MPPTFSDRRVLLWLAVACTTCCGALEQPSANSSDAQATFIPNTFLSARNSDLNFHDDENSLDSSKSASAPVDVGITENVKQDVTNTGNVTVLRVTCPVQHSLVTVSNPTPSYSLNDPSQGLVLHNNITTSSATSKPILSVASHLNDVILSDSLEYVNLSTLVYDGNVEVSMEVEGCHYLGLDSGIPEWIERLSLANEGILVFQKGWAAQASHLKKLWFRISKNLVQHENLESGYSVRVLEEDSQSGTEKSLDSLCNFLPPYLEVFDGSHTPLNILALDEDCSSKLLRLEASHSSIVSVALCTPSLVTLHLSWNSIKGDLEWAACKDGLAAVEYLQVNQNSLSEVSTCGWDGLRTLDLRRNTIISLDLSTCPSSNLTSVTASHNELITPPVLPQALLHLDLNHNLLESLPMITSTLMTADFSHNSIIEIGKSRFKRARKLLHLSLAYNRITHLKEHDLKGLRELRRLDISHNRLREIAGASLMSLRRLEELYIHHNHLTKLDARDLASLIPRTYATLHHNPWLCSCQLLSALQRLQYCTDCKHRLLTVPVECKERGSWVAASAVLRSCLQAVQDVTHRLNDESDEDLSEEIDDKKESEDGDPGVVMAVPGVLILILIGAAAAVVYRWYGRNKRTLNSRLLPFCNRCRCCTICGCSPVSMNKNDLNHHGQLSHTDHDSDTETEL
ncbi:hypothetical protein SK128_022061 [Halocaridina rubra]|uniref:Uncharacterized protein n=1 Tax=Halocaridina rubra TaxID=373956 RepID=A0AAN8XBK2_HALRR